MHADPLNGSAKPEMRSLKRLIAYKYQVHWESQNRQGNIVISPLEDLAQLYPEESYPGG